MDGIDGWHFNLYFRGICSVSLSSARRLVFEPVPFDRWSRADRPPKQCSQIRHLNCFLSTRREAKRPQGKQLLN